MKLVTFIPTGQAAARIGALLSDEITLADLTAAARLLWGKVLPHFADMLALLDGGPAAFDEARTALAFVDRERPAGVTCPLAHARLLAPVPRPRSIRDCMTFERHVIQCIQAVVRHRMPLLAALDRGLRRLTGQDLLRPPAVWYERPTYYKGNPHSVVGPEADISWPAYSRRLDYELEFGIFVGRQGKNISEERAHEYIAGYTIFNDFSARDIQGREMNARLGPSKGKDFDTGNALGPYLVTPDDVPDPYNLAMIARVNSQEWSHSTSTGMRFRFEELVAFISQEETLYPGEFIGSGAVGNGCGLELDRWLKPDDVIELEVERLGILRNRVVRAG
jgi:2-keto-4-pentenoate hydratase/2-oxohepta-3-ene-1,7-dioic acid hydratase in catechol pathway